MAGRAAKVFGIGLSRTATTSLTRALQILGYRTVHFPWLLEYRNGSLFPDFSLVVRYDALTDTPVARFFKELEREFTGSKFILTIRERENWLQSCEEYFYQGRFEEGSPALGFLPFEAVKRLHLDLYGVTEYDRTEFATAYDRHVTEVKCHFRGKEDQLLIFDICGGEGWEPLCEFLEKPLPRQDFPRLHMARKRR